MSELESDLVDLSIFLIEPVRNLEIKNISKIEISKIKPKRMRDRSPYDNCRDKEALTRSFIFREMRGFSIPELCVYLGLHENIAKTFGFVAIPSYNIFLRFSKSQNNNIIIKNNIKLLERAISPEFYHYSKIIVGEDKKKVRNSYKINIIKNVFKWNEKLLLREIYERTSILGYDFGNRKDIGMFMRKRMEYETIRIDHLYGMNFYSLI